jgi:RimJ/RimL family protein N-acetyltransferase
VAEGQLAFVRLTEVPLAEVLGLLNEPLNLRHMPLSETFTEESAAAWVVAKDAQWEQHGYGPWAVLVDGAFAGWGGFQREENGADFALVLLPEHWGVGLAVTRAALERGFRELGLDAVIIALPFTRSPERAVARLGFVPDGEVSYGGSDFRQFRLTRAAWEAAQASTSVGGSDVAARATTSGMPKLSSTRARSTSPP